MPTFVEWGRRVVALVAALALVGGTAGCPRGSEGLVPKTRKGWGVAFIIVGGAWIVTGGVVAADGDGERSAAPPQPSAAVGVPPPPPPPPPP